MDLILYAIGFVIYAVIGIWAAVKVWKICKRGDLGLAARAAWTFIFLAMYVLVPFGDQIVGTQYLDHLCRTQGGLKVMKKVDNIQGFLALNKNFPLEPSRTWPFRYIETETRNDGVVRVTLVNGKKTRENNVKPVSNYRYREQASVMPIGVKKYEGIIDEIRTGEILATEVSFYYPGGWLWRRLFSVYGPGSGCAITPRLSVKIHEVLIPSPALSPDKGE